MTDASRLEALRKRGILGEDAATTLATLNNIDAELRRLNTLTAHLLKLRKRLIE